MKPDFAGTYHNQFYLERDGKLHIVPAQIFHRYWREPDSCNKIEDYEKNLGGTTELVKFFEKYCSKDDKIFEPGCSVGRNLHHLYEAGFTNLSGLDINKDAIELGSKFYPNTVAKIPRVVSSIEDYMVKSPTPSFDVLFTMGFFMHIHPSSEWIFLSCEECVKKYIITGETENEFSSRAVGRNYKHIFKDMKQIEEKYCEFENTIDKTGKAKIMFRVFKKDGYET